MKTIRIKNKFRFIIFVTVIIILMSMLLGVFFPVTALSDVSGEPYIEICVKDGDTLWGLAKMYGDPNRDIREIIYDICSMNNITASELVSGSHIIIPQ